MSPTTKKQSAKKTGAAKKAAPRKRRVPGTVLRGADGGLYFLSNTALKHFKVKHPADQNTLQTFFAAPEAGTDVAGELQGNVEAKQVVAPIENLIIK
jgi:hypothetical protein